MKQTGLPGLFAWASDNLEAGPGVQFGIPTCALPHSQSLGPYFGPLPPVIVFPIYSSRDGRLDSFTLHMPGMGLCREKGREVSRISLAHSRAGFFTLSTDDIWGQITMCVGGAGRDGCLMHCSLLAVSLALYPLDTSSILHPLSCDKQKCLLELSNVPW